jgi:hypothetical protein
MNRNMEAYLDLIARGSLKVEPLMDRIVSIEEAPQVYETLAKSEGVLPLGVVIRYPERHADRRCRRDADRDSGHRACRRSDQVGAGRRRIVRDVDAGAAVPAARQDFFLHAVVSRNGSRGGNFARENRVPVFTSQLDDVLADAEIGLVVIATRHSDHASQVVRALEAGKHVFVEKPLCLNWTELEAIVTAYERLDPKPILMVGFNRRFSRPWRKCAN